MNKVTKAVVLAGGYGTRWLPITKAIDKCMLPIGNRPIIDYVVQDCIKAGISDIYIALGQLGDQIRAYYSRNVNLERYLHDKEKAEALALSANLPEARIHFFDGSNWVNEPQGTSVPVARFAQNNHIDDDESVVVVGGDDFVYRLDDTSAIRQLIDSTLAAGATSGAIGVPVPKEMVTRFGVFDIASDGSFVKVVEKPAVEEAPSNVINVSKYLFDKEMLNNIVWTMDNVNPVRKEAELTDAINRYVSQGHKMHIARVSGEYLDGGTIQSWLYANQRIWADIKAQANPRQK